MLAISRFSSVLLPVVFCLAFSALPAPGLAQGASGEPVMASGQDCPRVVSQSPYISRNLAWLGAEHCIVGASRFDRLDVPDTGGLADIDAAVLAELAADVLLVSDWTPEAHAREVMPADTRLVRLPSFDRMVDLERTVEVLALAIDHPSPSTAREQFAERWRKAAEGIDGAGQRVLLLAGCGETAYSFGPDTWQFDLFAQLGFEPVEEHQPGVRLFPREGFQQALTDYIEQSQPDVLMVFRDELATVCRGLALQQAVRVIDLPGSMFLHATPAIIDGLHELRTVWQQDDNGMAE